MIMPDASNRSSWRLTDEAVRARGDLHPNSAAVPGVDSLEDVGALGHQHAELRVVEHDHVPAHAQQKESRPEAAAPESGYMIAS